jgi:hypothetical protein
LARNDCYNNLVLLKNLWDRNCLGQGKCFCDPCEWGMKQIKRYVCAWDWTSTYGIHAVPQFFFWQFHGLYSKENQCSGWIFQGWLLNLWCTATHHKLTQAPKHYFSSVLEPKVGLIQNEVNRLVRLIVTHVNQVEYNSMYKGVTLCGILQLPPRGLVAGKLWPYIRFQVGATQAHDNC